jgi:microcystin-dependent protein
MSDCTQCDPCEIEIPVICEELDIVDSANRIVVESESSCKGSMLGAEEVSILQNTEWNSGSLGNPVTIPLLQDHDIDNAPKIVVIENDGTLKNWEPSNAGDNFLAYWDGSQFTIGTLLSLLPVGDGVFVKNGASLSFQNGINGQYLIISGGNIQFQTTSGATPPSGVIMCYAGAVAPSGWLMCDGTPYGRTLLDPSPQPTLFSILGTIYGAGDGTTTFNIPDLRGVFTRGLDNGRGIDPIRAIGTQQPPAFQSLNHGGVSELESLHTHTVTGNTQNQSNNHTHFHSNTNEFGRTSLQATNYNVNIHFAGAGFNAAGTNTAATIGLTNTESTGHIHSFSGTSSTATAHNHSINSYGGTETRPVNFALNWIIKT